MAPIAAMTPTAGLLAAHELWHLPLGYKVLALVPLVAFVGFALWVMTKYMMAIRTLSRRRRKLSRRDKKIAMVAVGALVLFEAGGFVVGYLVGSPSDRVLAGFVGVGMGGVAYLLACWVVGGFIFAHQVKTGARPGWAHTEHKDTIAKKDP